MRTAAEHSAGHIPGSINLPLDELRDHLDDLPGSDLIVYCQVGQRGHTATALLTGLGHAAANLDGGYRTWQAGNAARPPSETHESLYGRRPVDVEAPRCSGSMALPR